jgi:hypothetical protein
MAVGLNILLGGSRAAPWFALSSRVCAIPRCVQPGECVLILMRRKSRFPKRKYPHSPRLHRRLTEPCSGPLLAMHLQSGIDSVKPTLMGLLRHSKRFFGRFQGMNPVKSLIWALRRDGPLDTREVVPSGRDFMSGSDEKAFYIRLLAGADFDHQMTSGH